MNQSKIYHGGGGRGGASTGYGHTLVDKLVNSAGVTVAKAVRDGAFDEFHITVSDWYADDDLYCYYFRDLQQFVDRDWYFYADREVEIDAGENIYLYAATYFDIYANADIAIEADTTVGITAHGNGISILCDGANPAIQAAMTAPTIAISSTHATGSMILVSVSGSLLVPIIKSGANQAAAGALAGEIWHDTTDNTLKYGI